VLPAPISIPLTIEAGTPIKVTLDREIRVRRVGETVHGKVAEPVYAFNQLLIPAGTEVFGRISSIESIPKKQRTLSALNADFSPPHHLSVTFDELVFPEGRRLAIQTTVSPAPEGTLRFVTASQKRSAATQANTAQMNEPKGRVSREVADVREDLEGKWTSMEKQVSSPGKMHRLERFAMAESPYRPQYLDPGTVFDASLKAPISFGREQLKPEALAAVGTEPPSGSVVHARLITALSSATAKRGDPVDAVITEPLISSNNLFFPEGSHLQGTVLQAKRARWLSHSGELRITFHQIVPPNGLPQKIESSLRGVSVANADHLVLDSENGARVTQPKSRYFTTALSLALAQSAVLDRDAGRRTTSNASGGDVGKGAATGAYGFRLVGTILGAASRSRVVTSGLGFYGASMSVYSHFLARGRDVVYPKNMSMLIELGPRASKSKSAQAR
jgi:hypothetical protein